MKLMSDQSFVVDLTQNVSLTQMQSTLAILASGCGADFYKH